MTVPNYPIWDHRHPLKRVKYAKKQLEHAYDAADYDIRDDIDRAVNHLEELEASLALWEDCDSIDEYLRRSRKGASEVVVGP